MMFVLKQPPLKLKSAMRGKVQPKAKSVGCFLMSKCTTYCQNVPNIVKQYNNMLNKNGMVWYGMVNPIRKAPLGEGLENVARKNMEKL